MRVIVGATSVPVSVTDRSFMLLQNLGPGIIYLDTDGDVTPDEGLQIRPGEVYEFASPSSQSNVYIVSTLEGTDVRVIRV